MPVDGDYVVARRAGWNEKLTAEQELDLIPAGEDEPLEGDVLRGLLEVVWGTDPTGADFPMYLVDGQEADRWSVEGAEPPTANAGDNCGTGSGGFKPGNKCAKGGGGVEGYKELKAKASKEQMAKLNVLKKQRAELNKKAKDGTEHDKFMAKRKAIEIKQLKQEIMGTKPKLASEKDLPEITKSYIDDAADIAKSNYAADKVLRYKQKMEANDTRLTVTQEKVAKLHDKTASAEKSALSEQAKLKEAYGGPISPDNFGGWKYDNLSEISEQTKKTVAATSKLNTLKRQEKETAWGLIREGVADTPGSMPIAKVELSRDMSDSVKALDLTQIGNVNGAEKALSGMLSSYHQGFIDSATVRNIPDGQEQRSYFKGYRHNGPDQSIYITKGVGKEVVAHELGHALETSSAVHDMAVGFLHSRVGQEPAKPMGKGFLDYEVGREDQFSKAFGNARYVGKHYKSRDTEIISSGLEKMVSDPTGFAKRDPEYFKFTLMIMDGSAVL